MLCRSHVDVPISYACRVQVNGLCNQLVPPVTFSKSVSKFHANYPSRNFFLLVEPVRYLFLRFF